MSQKLSDEEKACYRLEYMHNYKNDVFLGYAASALSGTDFKPSAPWLIAHSPNSITYKLTNGNMQKYDLEQNCDDFSLSIYSYTIQKYGMVSVDCIPNTAEIPSDLTKCKDGSALDTKLKGYTEGTSYN